MSIFRRALVAAFLTAFVLSGSGRRPASAQFGGLGGLLDPKRAAVGAAAKALQPYIAEQTPIRLDPVELYPTIDALPGPPFSPSTATATATFASIVKQLKQSTTGTVALAPGDYAVNVRLFCMSHSRPARAPLAFVLGPMAGKRAPAIVAMNSRAAATPLEFHTIQTTSWTIQGGLGYADFATEQKAVVNRLIPDYRSALASSTLDDIEGKWSSLSQNVGGPSIDTILGQLGGAGRLVTELRDDRAQLLGHASDFESLRHSFAPPARNDGAPQTSLWSVVDPTLWMRLVTSGHYGDIGTIQIRIVGTTTATVPLVSSIAYGRCTPQITTSGSAYTCTQPLSFEPIKEAALP